MPSNTTYNPENIKDFIKTNLHFLGKSIRFNAASGAETSGVHTLTDDVLVTGGILLVKGGNLNDRIYLDVLAPNDALLLTFVDGFVIRPDTVNQLNLDLNYPAKLFTGFKIRARYVADSAAGEREVGVNLFLHKVLV